MELTEILVAVKQPEIQNNTLQEPKHETSRNGKSFSELLAGLSSENQTPDTPENEVKRVETAENKEKVSSKDDSKKENPEEKVRTAEKDGKKVENKVAEDSETEEKTEKPDYLAILNLNQIKEENVKASEPVIDSSKITEINEVSSELLEKLAQSNDDERIKMLSSAGNIEVSDDFEFEIVSDEALALESAQTLSVEKPADFLENTVFADFTQENTEADNHTAKAEVEKTPLDKLKSRISVTDLRNEKVQDHEIVKDEAEPKLKVTMTGSDSATVEMNLKANQEFVAGDVLSNNSQVAASDGSTFQSMLNNQIQANAAEIVKAGNIVLKDNNKGTINLVLHPDDIGNVKMTLSLDGDKITGHIAVNTKEALEVFKNNAESLREAFMKNGYENASFEVSYNNASGNGQQFAENNQQNQNNFFGKREYSSLDMVADVAGSAGISEEFAEISKNGINIVA